MVEELERAQQRVAEMEAERAHAMQKKADAAPLDDGECTPKGGGDGGGARTRSAEDEAPEEEGAAALDDRGSPPLARPPHAAGAGARGDAEEVGVIRRRQPPRMTVGSPLGSTSPGPCMH